jgi:hypothetical protein
VDRSLIDVFNSRNPLEVGNCRLELTLDLVDKALVTASSGEINRHRPATAKQAPRPTQGRRLGRSSLSRPRRWTGGFDHWIVHGSADRVGMHPLFMIDFI